MKPGCPLGLGIVLCGLVCSLATTAAAQTVGGPRPVGTAAPAWGFLSAFRTELDITHLRGADADDQFNWDADVSIDVDVVDTRWVRGNLYVNVETIIGSELRGVDPNQNNYTADVSAFVRLPQGELQTTFHHVSRHLGDRATDTSISWNMFGLGYSHRFAAGRWTFDTQGRALWTVERAGVDYDAQYEGHVAVVRRLTERFAVIARAEGVAMLLDPAEFGRRDAQGGRVEGGLRIVSGVAAVDLYAAREQRIDATSRRRELVRWTQLGIRVTTPLP